MFAFIVSINLFEIVLTCPTYLLENFHIMEGHPVCFAHIQLRLGKVSAVTYHMYLWKNVCVCKSVCVCVSVFEMCHCQCSLHVN